MDIDQLVNDLTKPLYVYRMARAMAYPNTRYGDPHPAMTRSAKTRLKNAERQIADIVRKHVTEDED